MEDIKKLFKKVKGFSLLSLEIQNEIINIINKISIEFPEILEYLDFLKFEKFPTKGTGKCFFLKNFTNKLHIVISFNLLDFSKNLKELNLFIKESYTKNKIAPFDIQGIVAHEFGHLLILILICKYFNIKLNESISNEIYNKIQDLWSKNIIEQFLIENCVKFNTFTILDFYNENLIKEQISEYANMNFSEFFAEAFVQYITNKVPNNLSKEIVQNYKFYLKNISSLYNKYPFT